MKSENFSISEKFYETVKSIYFFFLYCEFAKTVSFLVIYKYLIHFVSVVTAKMLMSSISLW